jgi:hypothetical protein
MASAQGQGNVLASVSGGFWPIFQRFYGALSGSMRRKSEQSRAIPLIRTPPLEWGRISLSF